MDEAALQKLLRETAEYYENKYQPQIEKLMGDIRRLQGKYNRLDNKYEALRNSVNKKNRKERQHFRNQTGGAKGIRR